MKKDLEQQLREVLNSGENPENAFGKAFQEYAERISKAINPIDIISAPFIVAALEMYKRQIVIRIPEVEDAAQNLIDHLPVQYVTIPINRKNE